MSTVRFPLHTLLACDRANGLRPPAHWYMPEVEFPPAPVPVLRADRCHVKVVLAVSRAYLAPAAAAVPASRWRAALTSRAGIIVGFGLGGALWGWLLAHVFAAFSAR